MATSNHLYRFEGDPTQPLPSFVYRYRREVLPYQMCPAYARVLFDKGDLDDFWTWVDIRREALKTNQMILSEYGINGAGGRIGGGFWFSVVPIAGARLIDEITVGSIVMDIETVPIYAGVLQLTLNIYRSGTLVKAIDVTNDKPFRTGINQRGNDWQFELTGNVERIKRLDVASSVSELSQIEAV